MFCAVILTALPVEYLAVRTHLQALREEVYAQGTIYERGTFSAAGQEWKVGIVGTAAGEKVIASTQSEVFQFLRENYGDVIVLEIEGLGSLEAARANYPVEMIVMRGISNLINEIYDDGMTDELENFVFRQDKPKNQQISAIAIREALNSTDRMITDQSSSQKLAACHASAFAFEVLARFRQVPNNVPRSGVSNFVGRDAELEWLHTQLQAENPILISVIGGMGGVGKTELAIQYTQQHSLSYEGGVC